jgi:hypothetical protein
VNGLERALTSNRAEVERELVKAEADMEGLRLQERALASAIKRARYVLGLEVEMSTPAGNPAERGRMLLHDALVDILRGRDNQAMTARELADEVNRTGIYHKRDSSPVAVSQVHARVHNYDRLFVRGGGRIRLRDDVEREYDPALLARFDAAMLEVYDAAMREVRYPARRFLDMTRRRGGLDAARHLLAKPGVSDGFRKLAAAGKLELTMEYQVLRPEFVELFSEEEQGIARERLASNTFDKE